MCGIVFVSRDDKKSAVKMTLKRFRNQRSRGTLGFGYISLDEQGKFKGWGRSKDERGIEKLMEEDNSPTFMFHHRMPTSTPNFIEATHPIKVSKESLDHDYYVVHNGIITNCDELKKEHDLEGFEYTTTIREDYVTKSCTYSREMYNDSESLAIELAKVLDGDQKAIGAKGSIAFIALQVNKTTGKVLNIFFGRNYANPLKLFEGKDFFSLASEGQGETIDPDKLYRYSWNEKKFYISDLDIGKTTLTYDKGKYPNYHNHQPKSPIMPRRMGFRTADEDENDDVEAPRKNSMYGFGGKETTIELPPPKNNIVTPPDLRDEEEDFEYQDDPDAVVIALYEEADQLEEEIELYTEYGMTYKVDELRKKLAEIRADIEDFEEDERNQKLEFSGS